MSINFTRTTVPQRPVWLAEGIIPQDLVERIHEHADRGAPFLERIVEWCEAATELQRQYDAATDGKLPSLDNFEFCVDRWTGMRRLNAASILLDRFSNFQDHAVTELCSPRHSTEEMLSELRGERYLEAAG